MQPKQARGTFRKHITKPSEQVAAPPSMTSAQRGEGKKISNFADKQYIEFGKRRGRSKNPKNLRTSYMEAPLYQNSNLQSSDISFLNIKVNNV